MGRAIQYTMLGESMKLYWGTEDNYQEMSWKYVMCIGLHHHGCVHLDSKWLRAWSRLVSPQFLIYEYKEDCGPLLILSLQHLIEQFLKLWAPLSKLHRHWVVNILKRSQLVARTGWLWHVYLPRGCHCTASQACGKINQHQDETEVIPTLQNHHFVQNLLPCLQRITTIIATTTTTNAALTIPVTPASMLTSCSTSNLPFAVWGVFLL